MYLLLKTFPGLQITPPGSMRPSANKLHFSLRSRPRNGQQSHHLPPHVIPLRTAPFSLHLPRLCELLIRLPATSDDSSSGRGVRFPKGNIRDLDGWWAITLLIPPGSHCSLLLCSACNFQRVTNLILKECDSNECWGCVVRGCGIKWEQLQYQ